MMELSPLQTILGKVAVPVTLETDIFDHAIAGKIAIKLAQKTATRTIAKYAASHLGKPLIEEQKDSPNLPVALPGLAELAIVGPDVSTLPRNL